MFPFYEYIMDFMQQFLNIMGEFVQFQSPKEVIFYGYTIPRWMQHLAVYCFMHIMFLMTCIYYLLKLQKQQPFTIPRMSIAILLKLRSHLTLFVAAFSAMQSAVDVFANNKVLWVSCMQNGVSMSSWLTHYKYLCILEKGYSRNLCGHAAVHVGWCFGVIATLYQILFPMHHSEQDIDSFRIGTFFLYMKCLAHGLNFLLMIFTIVIDPETNMVYLTAICHLITQYLCKLYYMLNYFYISCKTCIGNVKNNVMGLENSRDYKFSESFNVFAVDRKFHYAYEQLQAKLEYISSQNFPPFSGTIKRYAPLLETLIEQYGASCLAVSLLRLISECAWILVFVFLFHFLSSMEEGNQVDTYMLLGIHSCLFLHYYFSFIYCYKFHQITYKLKTSISSLVFRKVITLSMNELKRLTKDQIFKHMYLDIDKIENMCIEFYNVWSLGLQLLAYVYLLHMRISWSCIGVLIYGLVSLYLNCRVNDILNNLNEQLSSRTFARLKMTRASVKGIPVIKLHAWEPYFLKWIADIREQELYFLKKRATVEGISTHFWSTSAVIVTFATILVHRLISETDISLSQIALITLLHNHIVQCLNSLPRSFKSMNEGWHSIQHLEKFLLRPEIEPQMFYSYEDNNLHSHTALLIQMINSIFSWEESGHRHASHQIRNRKNPFVLGPVNLEIYSGQFVGIYGRTKSGKTSLVHAIMGEMSKREGVVWIRDMEDGFAYVPQKPWIQNDTIKANVLFGLNFDEKFYWEVLKLCALADEIKSLNEQDNTIIGSEEIKMSESFKTRICIARAIYQNKDIYIFDDPFSSLEPHLANHIFFQCIERFLHSKTRIVCMNRKELLLNTDYIVLLKNGKAGSPTYVIGSKTSQILSSSALVDDSSLRCIQSKKLTNSSDSGFTESSCKKTSILDSDEGGMTAEASISVINTIWIYLKYAGIFSVFCMFLLLIFMQVSFNAIDFWIIKHSGAFFAKQNVSITENATIKQLHQRANNGQWVSGQFCFLSQCEYPRNETKLFHLELDVVRMLPGGFPLQVFLLYFAIIILHFVSSCCTVLLFSHIRAKACCLFHWVLLLKIFKAPLSCIGKFSISSILNILPSAITSLDENLPSAMHLLSLRVLSLCGMLMLFCCTIPPISLLFLPASIFFFKLQSRGRSTVREIENNAMSQYSQMVSNVQQILTGLITIRAFRQKDKMIISHLQLLQQYENNIFLLQLSKIWLNFKINTFSLILFIFISIATFLPSYTGFFMLVIINGLYLPSNLNNIFWSIINVDKEATPICRMVNWIQKTTLEPCYGNRVLVWNWPNRGAVSFENVSLFHNFYPVLQNVSLNIMPGEKFGIVDVSHTGAVILQSLFRIAEVSQGYIHIDNFSIQDVELSHLRSKISILPKATFVFPGSIRNNLDPCQQRLSHELWKVLGKCRLVSIVHQLGGLDDEIPEQLFTSGQKKLLCLARMLLLNSQIVCIDELQVNTDYDTTAIIMDTVQNQLNGKTILIVSQHPELLTFCDRLMILDKGKIVELDSPKKLLEKHETMYSRLVKRNRLITNKFQSKHSDKHPKSCASTTW